MQKRLLLLPAVLMISSAAFAASFQEGSTQGANNGGALTHAKEIYKIDCAICHGANGDGKTDLAVSLAVPMGDFTDPKVLQGKTDQELFDLIRKGKDPMPPEQSNRAKDAEIHALIQYIRGMSKGQAAPAVAATPASPTPN